MIRDFFISGERLYILAYSQPGRHPECVEMTLKGRLLRRFFPAIEEVSPIRLPPYTIHRNHLYRLLEDSEDDGWILDIARLE